MSKTKLTIKKVSIKIEGDFEILDSEGKVYS
jgi:spore germination protein GerM